MVKGNLGSRLAANKNQAKANVDQYICLNIVNIQRKGLAKLFLIVTIRTLQKKNFTQE